MLAITDRPMINISKVSAWLTQNANEQLYPRLFLMSPNGTLLAYSKPVDIKELRDQAALISITWKDNCSGRAQIGTQSDSAQDPSLKPALKTLTVETEGCNIIVRFIQPELLLVMVGRIPPKKKQQFQITQEGHGDPRYPEPNTSLSRPSSSSQLQLSNATQDNVTTSMDETSTSQKKAPSIMSNMSQREKDIRTGVLHIQRKRLDALATYILRDFAETGFTMPADSDLQ